MNLSSIHWFLFFFLYLFFGVSYPIYSGFLWWGPSQCFLGRIIFQISNLNAFTIDLSNFLGFFLISWFHGLFAHLWCINSIYWKYELIEKFMNLRFLALLESLSVLFLILILSSSYSFSRTLGSTSASSSPSSSSFYWLASFSASCSSARASSKPVTIFSDSGFSLTVFWAGFSVRSGSGGF